MNNVKTLVTGSLLAASAATSTAALAVDVTANIGVTSNYVWRGITQTKDGPAVQGGIDVGFGPSLYAGTWASNVDFSGAENDNNEYELDFYGGWAPSFGEFGLDLGTIYYAYPKGDDVNFWEIYAAGSWRWFTVGLNYTIDGQASKPSPFIDGDIYYYGQVDVPLPQDWSIGGTIGRYNFDKPGDAAEDYTWYNAYVGKSVGDWGDFAFTVSYADENVQQDDDDVRVYVSWLKEF